MEQTNSTSNQTTQTASQNTATQTAPSANSTSSNQETTQQTTSAPSSSKSETPSSKNSTASTESSTASDAKASDLILGKFKTHEDLAKAYQELEKKHSSRSPQSDISDDFDLAGVYKELGFQYDESDEAKAEFANLRTQLKEAGFTKDQSKKIFELQKQFAEDFLEQHGLKIDTEAERSALVTEWGDQAEAKYQAVTKWAADHLPTEVLNKPLRVTAAGVKMLEQLMQMRAGPTPITSTNDVSTAEQLADLNMQFTDLMKRPDYYANADIQAKARALTSRITALSQR